MKNGIKIVVLLNIAILIACEKISHEKSETANNNIATRLLTAEIITNPSDAFASTLYPLLKQNCATCHSSGGATPFFADADVALAFAEINKTNNVDLEQASQSRVVQKLIVENHNCWTIDCNADALTLQQAITDWGSIVNSGQQLYALQCANCHGANGQGIDNIVGVTRSIPFDQLTTIIETTMPTEDPTLCGAQCATDIANFIVNNFIFAETPLNKEPLAGFPEGQAQLDILCSRLAAQNVQNIVRDVFCAAAQPTITSLKELQSVLGLTFNNPTATGRRNNGANGNPAFTLLGHSSSLVARFTSTINPRALIFTPPRRGAGNGFITMGFVRGDQFVELATADRVTGQLQFYLFTFKQACTLSHTCTPGDLLTPAIESDWIDYTVYDQQDLANTILDCLQCHQPDGPNTRSLLRMQELRDPWTHFFRDDTQGGQALLADFFAAHGTNEDYAGIPANLISASDPELLEDLIVINGFNQPNEFLTERIEIQVNQTPGQPFDNSNPGSSSIWQALYNETVLGNFIATPYHDVKVTDPVKLTAMTSSYQAFLNGTLAKNDLPDIRDVFLDIGLRDMGFKVMAGLDGQQIITQACKQCHNSVLDQTISRARFNVDLNAMSDTTGGILSGAARDAEISLAIARLKLTPEDPKKMPPEMFKTLDPEEIEAAASYLCSQMIIKDSQCTNLAEFVPNPAPLPPAAVIGPGFGDED